MRRFITPREINYGWGALSALRYVEATKALIVTGKVVEGLGHVAKAQALLKERGIETKVFNGVEPNPTRETVSRIFTLAQEFEPDVIIGLGGGSPLDAGKAAWVLYEHPDLATMAWSDFLKAMRRRVLRRKARYIAVSCTSGTGSEVTCTAVITDNEATPPVKTRVISAYMVPDMAIVDAELASTMPTSVTVDTGYDALIHTIEGYLCAPPSDITDALAVAASQNIFNWLPKAVENGNDVTAREKMHLAATMAGMVISNGPLGLIHDCAEQVGTTFGIPHGRALASISRQFLAYLFPSVTSRMGELAKALGLKPNNDRDAAVKLIAAIEHLEKQIGIPSSMRGAGVDEKKFMAELDELSRLTVADHVEGPPAPEDVRELLLKAWEGTKIEVPSN